MKLKLISALKMYLAISIVVFKLQKQPFNLVLDSQSHFTSFI